MNPQEIMRAKYLGADSEIRSYFFFLGKYGTEKGPGTHEHHILPRKQFVQYADLKKFPENGVHLEFSDHMFAHRMLRNVHPDFGDVSAWIAAALSPEAKQKRRATLALPEVMARKLATAKITNALPETKKRRSYANKKRWENLTVRALLSAAIKSGANKPESIAKQKTSSKRRWGKPSVHEHHSVSQKKYNEEHPEALAKMKQTMKIVSGTPEARARMSAAAKIAMNRPEVKARTSAAQKKRFENIEERKLYSERQKTPEAAARCIKGGRKGQITAAHNRWHVKRGIVSLTCELCAVNLLVQ